MTVLINLGHLIAPPPNGFHQNFQLTDRSHIPNKIYIISASLSSRSTVDLRTLPTHHTELINMV